MRSLTKYSTYTLLPDIGSRLRHRKSKGLILIVLFIISINGFSQKDSSAIHQEIFPSLGKYALLTNDGSIYDNVVHGSLEFVEGQKIV